MLNTNKTLCSPVYICISFHFQDDLKQQANSERMAVNLSNIANLVLFAAKVYASIESKSLAVIASTLDSLLDLLSGFILWCTAYAMKKPNQFIYPIGKKRMQPVVSFHFDLSKLEWIKQFNCLTWWGLLVGFYIYI